MRSYEFQMRMGEDHVRAILKYALNKHDHLKFLWTHFKTIRSIENTWEERIWNSYERTWCSSKRISNTRILKYALNKHDHSYEIGRVCLRRISRLPTHDLRPYAFEIRMNATQNNSLHWKYMGRANLKFVWAYMMFVQTHFKCAHFEMRLKQTRPLIQGSMRN